MATHRVIHPTHYNAHPSGLECWDVIGRLPCHTSNAIKYLWRAGMKHDALCPLYLTKILTYSTYSARELGSVLRQIHDQTTPCNHCHAQDVAKAANYLRAEADRLRVEQAHYGYRMAVHDARPLLRQVATASAPDPRYSELCLVIGAVLMGTREALIEAADMLGPPAADARTRTMAQVSAGIACYVQGYTQGLAQPATIEGSADDDPWPADDDDPYPKDT